jgi:hypothetical protein
MQIRRWNALVAAIPFVAIMVGVFLASLVLVWGAIHYKKKFEVNGGKITPEARLPPMMIGSVFFAAGLFIMAWTAETSTHWIAFCIGSACLGLGFFTIFQSALGYLVDTYLTLSASVFAANMFMRSILAGSFPLFATACEYNKVLFGNLNTY